MKWIEPLFPTLIRTAVLSSGDLLEAQGANELRQVAGSSIGGSETDPLDENYFDATSWFWFAQVPPCHTAASPLGIGSNPLSEPSGYGITVTRSGGGTTAFHHDSGYYQECLNAGGTGEDVGWSTGTFFRPEMKGVLTIWIKTGSAVDTFRLWAGAINSSPMATDTPTFSNAAFRKAAGDTNWQTYTGSGGANTIQDSGVAVATDTKYKLQIDFRTANQVAFYINDVLVQTHTSASHNIPASTTNMGVYALLRTTGAVTRTLRIKRALLLVP